MGDTQSGPATVLDLFGDALSRQLLVLVVETPLSARDIAARLDVTLPTVYRRTDRLAEAGLLEVHNRIEDGNHYSTFETKVKRVEIEIDADGYGVGVEPRAQFTNAFDSFWTDFEDASAGWTDESANGIDPSGPRDDSSPS